MKLQSSKILFVIFFILLCISVSVAQAQTPQQTLNQYISDLQRNPNDNALREKIIKLVQGMKPKPAIPEEAREHYVMAATFVEKAKDNSGYERAIEQYKAALLAAPWWADAYKKQAIVQKAAAHYDDAIASLNLYILTLPADARDAQDEIYKLKALKQSTAQEREESSPQSVAAREEKKSEDWLKKLDGRRYTLGGSRGFTSVMDVRGKFIVRGYIPLGQGYHEGDRVEIRGREFTDPVEAIDAPVWPMSQTFIISEDGDRITLRTRFSDGDVREYIYLWQR